jgi:hypothetical protein
VKVGNAPRSLARYSVAGPPEVRTLLQSLHEEVPQALASAAEGG